MNITKEGKELYNEDFRTLRKEMKENPRRLKKKKLPRSWNERINIVIYGNTKKIMHQFQAISIKIPMSFITKIITCFMWNHKRSLVAKRVMNTKGSAGGNHTWF